MLLIQCPAKASNLFVSLSLSIFMDLDVIQATLTSCAIRYDCLKMCITASPVRHLELHLCITFVCTVHAHTSPACQGTHAKLWSLSKRMGGPCFEANDGETARWIGKILKLLVVGSCVLQWCGWGQFETATWTRNWFEAPINDAALSGALDI